MTAPRALDTLTSGVAMNGAEEIKRIKARRAIRRLISFVVLIPLLMGIGAYVYLSRDVRGTAPATPPSAATPIVRAPIAPPPPTAPPTPPRTPLPSLDKSDALIRQLAAALSSHPAFASWLVTDGLIRRFVVVVDNVSEGKLPHKHVPFLTPKGRFQTVERGGRTFVDPRSYSRYDGTAEAIVSLDTDGSAELYRRVRPLIQDAYRDLGYPNRNFDDALARAIERLLRTPIPEGDVAVRPAVKSVKYEKPELESLTPAQKQFLRMGPENMKRIKQKLRELAEALGLPKPPG
ncbi:MAG: DUF3014 domain-containing protein [Candidatus Binatia bacterium]